MTLNQIPPMNISAFATVSLVMEFLGNVFTDFIFEKLLSHEVPVT